MTLLALFVACADPEVDTGKAPTDLDGDGYAVADDCDDDDASIHPGADEVCDGLDDNCNDTVDEGVSDGTLYADADADGYGDPDVPLAACVAFPPEGFVTNDGDCDDADAAQTGPTWWYPDADADGYGVADGATEACDAPAGSSADAGDCDDASAEVHPGAEESCDATDRDCDGDPEAGATDAPLWYADADGDGYGDPDASMAACSAPDVYVADATDCDDGDAAWHPGAQESCDDPNDYDCDGVTAYTDADGDGWAECVECDDTRADVSPDATELCDGVDDDCDGVTDEDDAADAPTWYADTDGDGYGDPVAIAAACAQPSGFVSDATDCDDATADVFPGAAETCDDADDDCDGTTDEDATDAPSWYLDADGDGYGDAVAAVDCDQPSGTVALGGDCDDADAGVSPAATDLCETAGAQVDDDCSGTGDDATNARTWYADADGDGFGDAATPSTYCPASLPSGWVSSATDCDDRYDTVNPDGSESCDNDLDDNCDGSPDPCALTGTLSTYDFAIVGNTGSWNEGFWGVAVGDVDGDGDADVIAGQATDVSRTGYLSLYPGPDPASVSWTATSVLGEDAGDYFGQTVYAGGDIDADGRADVLVAAPYHDVGATSDAGAVYLYYGPFAPSSATAASADAIFEGDEASGSLGGADYQRNGLAEGDVDGDGLDDVLLASLSAAGGGSGRGAVYVFTDLPSGTLAPSDADYALTGIADGDHAGNPVPLGDADGDGTEDFAFAALDADATDTEVGAVYLYGSATAPLATGDLSGASATITGEVGDWYCGWTLDAVGDLDGDAIGEVAIGCYTHAVYVFSGATAGTHTTSDAGLTLSSGGDAIGYGMSGADLDGDGNRDLVIGKSGGASILYGPFASSYTLGDDADATLNTANYAYQLGVGDLDGDTYDDVVIAAWNSSDTLWGWWGGGY